MSEQTQQSPYAIPAAIVVAGALIAGALYFAQAKPAVANIPQQPGNMQPPTPSFVDQTVKGVQADDHVLGNKDAKVTLVEFSDAECPFCKMFHVTLKKLMKDYDGKISLVYRHYPLPFHHKAPTEAQALECAAKLGGNDAFWKFADALFDATPSNDGLDHSLFPEFAKAAGVDGAALVKCVKSEETKSLVDADQKEGEEVGVGGTPQTYVIVKGKQYSIEGAQSYDTVKRVVEEALAM